MSGRTRRCGQEHPAERQKAHAADRKTKKNAQDWREQARRHGTIKRYGNPHNATQSSGMTTAVCTRCTESLRVSNDGQTRDQGPKPVVVRPPGARRAPGGQSLQVPGSKIHVFEKSGAHACSGFCEHPDVQKSCSFWHETCGSLPPRRTLGAARSINCTMRS